jgi:predicted Rossmann-fold nucleotide-binding protein
MPPVPQTKWLRNWCEGIGLVYGSGNVGLMGILADTVLRAGGEA